MAGTHFSRVLKTKVDEAIRRVVEVNGRGAAGNYEEYRHNAGHIAGLEAALRMIEELEGEEDR